MDRKDSVRRARVQKAQGGGVWGGWGLSSTETSGAELRPHGRLRYRVAVKKTSVAKEGSRIWKRRDLRCRPPPLLPPRGRRCKRLPLNGQNHQLPAVRPAAEVIPLRPLGIPNRRLASNPGKSAVTPTQTRLTSEQRVNQRRHANHAVDPEPPPVGKCGRGGDF